MTPPRAWSAEPGGAEAGPVGRARDFFVRNVRWARAHDAVTATHAVLLARYAQMRLTQPWIETDGVVFMGRNVDLTARRGMGHIRVGRFVWIGNGNAIRCHEGHLGIGDKTVFGSNNVVNCYLDVEIGAECIFADWIYLTDFDHRFEEPDVPIRSQGIDTSPVRIGDGVWIGEKATILRGVTVGEGAVIGSHALVTADVPPGAIVGGVPARVLKTRKGWEDGPPPQRHGGSGW